MRRAHAYTHMLARLHPAREFARPNSHSHTYLPLHAYCVQLLDTYYTQREDTSRDSPSFALFILLRIPLPSLSLSISAPFCLCLCLRLSVSVSLCLSPFSVTHSLHQPPSVLWYSTSHGLFSSPPMSTAFAQVMQRTNPQFPTLHPTPSTLNSKS